VRDLFVGSMSGTSLDGVDAALVEVASHRPRLLDTAYLPLLGPLKTELHALRAPPGTKRAGSRRKDRQ